ncbi:hypothetical protein NU195Hw_g6761t1 [Hortaea werneckii]
MAKMSGFFLIALLAVLPKVLVVTTTVPSTKTTTELLSNFNFTDADLPGSPAVLLETVVYAYGQEKDPLTDNLVTTTAIDIRIPSLRWRISREYKDTSGAFARAFANVDVG